MATVISLTVIDTQQLVRRFCFANDPLSISLSSLSLLGRHSVLFALHMGDQIFTPNPASAIDEHPFPCYNAFTEIIKEASFMGETPGKQNISAGLLAHV